MQIIRLRKGERIPDAFLKQNMYYRGLGENAQKEYEEKHYQDPKPGEISVGTGVFFSDSFDYARSFAKSIILVSTKEKLSLGTKIIDTREKGYHIPIEEKLRKENSGCTHWDVHSKVLEYDTLSKAPSLSSTIYSARRRISDKDLVAKIILR